MKVLLRIEVEVVVFFTLIEELLLHTILSTLKILFHFELLGSQVVHDLDIALEEVFRHQIIITEQLTSQSNVEK